MAATVCLLIAVATTPAGAIIDYGWHLKASGAVHITADGNHWAVDAYTANGTPVGNVYDAWLDWNCQVQSITGGDNQGTPFRMLLTSPPGSGVACIPNSDGAHNYWNQFYGWSSGVGWQSGQNWYSPWYVVETNVYVFPRDAATVESRGTLVEIY